MIRLLQRIGHRESVVGFVCWSLFTAVYVQIAAQPLAMWFVWPAIPILTAIGTMVLGGMVGRSTARRGAGVAITFLALNAFPFLSAGAIVTAFAPSIGGPMVLAPVLLVVGGILGIRLRKPTDSYQNPGNALVGAGAALVVLSFAAWLAWSAMDAAWGRGITEIRIYAATYGCIDPPHERLANAIQTMGSQFNRDRLAYDPRRSDLMRCVP